MKNTTSTFLATAAKGAQVISRSPPLVVMASADSADRRITGGEFHANLSQVERLVTSKYQTDGASDSVDLSEATTARSQAPSSGASSSQMQGLTRGGAISLAAKKGSLHEISRANSTKRVEADVSHSHLNHNCRESSHTYSTGRKSKGKHGFRGVSKNAKKFAAQVRAVVRVWVLCGASVRACVSCSLAGPLGWIYLAGYERHTRELYRHTVAFEL